MPTEKIVASKLQSTLASLIIGVLGIVISLLIYYRLYDLENRLVYTEFQRDANSLISSLEREIAINVAALESTWGLYIASDFVSREEFHKFTTPILERNKSLQALEWVPYVSGEERTQYVIDARESGYSSFDFTEHGIQGGLVSADEREEYFPVYYTEPLTGNEQTLGYDLGSEPNLKATLIRSARTGKMLATTRIELRQETGNQFAFLVFKPLLNKNESPAYETNTSKVEGFIVGTFRIRGLFQQALNYIPPKDIEVHLFDMTAPEGSRLIHSHNGDYKPSLLSEEEINKKIQENKGPSFARNLNISGVTWNIWFKPSREYVADLRGYVPLTSLIIGLLLSLLVSLYVHFIVEREERVISLVHQRTAELRDEIVERKLVEEEIRELNAHLEDRVKERTMAVSTSLKEKEVLLQEVHHRVKNNLQIIQSMLNLQSRGMTDPDILDVLTTSRDRVYSIALIHENLYRSEEIGVVDLQTYFEKLCRNLHISYSKQIKTVNYEVNVDNVPVNLTQAVPCGLIVNELVSNSLKYAFPDKDVGCITICSRIDGDDCTISVQDDGVGMPAVTNNKNDTSLGLQLVKMLVQQLDGELETNHEHGTTVKFTFPLKPFEGESS